jgi:hypothetical protein
VADSRALIQRFSNGQLEEVHVAARARLGVIYFDDVEDGFDFSPIDAADKLVNPGAANRSLSEAVERFLVPLTWG